MIERLKKHWEILLIFFFSLTPILWLRNGEVIIGHDSGFRLNYVEHLKNLFYSWNSLHNFGEDWSILKGFLVIQSPETFFSLIFNSLSKGETLSFILWFFIIGISMYIFLRNFFPQREFWLLRVFASLFYMFNFFVLQAWFIAERSKFSLLAALPLGILIFHKVLTRRYSLMKGTILFSFLSFFLNGGGSPPLYGSLLLGYSIVFVFLTFSNFLKRGLREIIFSLKVILSFVLGFIAVNAYFVVPQFFQILNKYSSILSSIGGIQGILSWENAVNKFASFTNLLRLQGIPDWYDNPSHPYSDFFINNPVLVLLSFVPLLIIIVGLLLQSKLDLIKRKDHFFYLIFSLLIIGLIFASGSHRPLGFLYIFLVQHVPGFAIFRSAFYKFGPVVWFSIIVLTGYYLNLLLSRFVKNRNLYKLLSIVSILYLIGFHFPYFTVNFFEFSKPFTTKVKIPSYVNNSASYINKLPNDTKILLTPTLDPTFREDSYRWGFWSLENLPKLAFNKPVVANDNASPPIVDDIFRSLSQGDQLSFLRLSGVAGINKILWRQDLLYNDKATKSDNFSPEREKLSLILGISLEKNFDEWTLYDISSNYILPKFYSPERVNYIHSNNTSLKDYLTEDNISFIFSADNKNINRKNINNEYIQLDCILCKDKELESLERDLDIPDVRVLPGSIFYNFKLLYEKIQENKHKGSPTQLIDFNISVSTKRLSEMAGITFSENLKTESKRILLEDSLRRYKRSIRSALSLLNSLPISDRNNYFIKLLAYLEVEKDLLDKLHYRSGFPNYLYDGSSLFIKKNIDYLSQNAWISRQSNQKRFIFSSYDKNYKLEFLKGETLPEKIILDGREISNFNLNIEGEHRLELLYKQLDILGNVGEISLINDEGKSISVKNLIPNNRYILSFEYKITEGDNSKISINSKDDKFIHNETNLTKSSGWQVYSYEFDPTILKDSLLLTLKNESLETNKTDIRNVSLSKVFIPKLFLVKNLKRDKFISPSVSYTEVNPTEYLVHIKGAQTPYFLNFGESFDKGWKISLGGANHFKVNGYANSWFIDKTGDYDLLVSFEPQRLFYLGGVISIFSLITFLLIFFRIGKRSRI